MDAVCNGRTLIYQACAGSRADLLVPLCKCILLSACCLFIIADIQFLSRQPVGAKPNVNLRDTEDGRLPIHEFVMNADPKPDELPTYEKVLDLFLELEADINGPLNDNGDTLLHVVSSVPIFKLLINKEANPAATTK